MSGQPPAAETKGRFDSLFCDADMHLMRLVLKQRPFEKSRGDVGKTNNDIASTLSRATNMVFTVRQVTERVKILDAKYSKFPSESCRASGIDERYLEVYGLREDYRSLVRDAQDAKKRRKIRPRRLQIARCQSVLPP